MRLNTQQIDFIEADIKKRGLSKKALRGEILDHICCAVEQAISSGVLFHKAYLQVLEEFGENGLLQLQEADKQALKGRQIIKKASMFTTTTAACLLLFITTIGNAQDIPNLHPLKGDTPVTSNYGIKMHPILKKKKLHKGIDFKTPIGTPVYATASGQIKDSKDLHANYGNTIIIKHDETYTTLYAHLSKLNVKPGQKVQKGDLIGYSGNSGASTGPHLHYEVRKNGESVDPEIYLDWGK